MWSPSRSRMNHDAALVGPEGLWPVLRMGRSHKPHLTEERLNIYWWIRELEHLILFILWKVFTEHLQCALSSEKHKDENFWVGKEKIAKAYK